MKKILTAIAILFAILTANTAKSQSYNPITYPFNYNSSNLMLALDNQSTFIDLIYIYQTDSNTIEYDYFPITCWTNQAIQIPALDSSNASINTATRLVGINNKGFLDPIDVSALPKQTLSVSSHSVTISGGNTIVTPDNQTLSVSSHSVTISGGNTIVTPDNQTLSISSNSVTISGGNTIILPTGTAAYTNTVAVAGGAGNAIFYLTSDKTSTGTALYTSASTIFPTPIVNDATTNYTYGWSYNATTKALTVNCKSNPSVVSGLLTLIGLPQNVANGIVIQLTVNGN